MNHPIDLDPESCRRKHSKRLKLLDTLIDKIIQRMDDNSCQPKIRDALKAIQLKEKLSEAKSVGVAKTPEGENTQRLLRHPLGRPTTFMVSFRTIYAEFRSTCAESRSILRIQI
ncbi:MAG: hypothetical protein WBF13_05080 [Candidatus Zixiibacteriota bacterium]